MRVTDPAQAVEAALGTRAVATHPLGGTVFLVELSDGDRVVAKHGDEGALQCEAAGLVWLAEAGLPAAGVRASEPGWLVLDWIEPGRPTSRAAEDLGRALAVGHRAGASAFGCPPPGGRTDAWIGNAPMANATAPRWPEWYAEYRIRPYLRRARDDGTLGARRSAPIEAVCDRITELAGPPEPPARLHGDLWSGNVLWSSDGTARLIDPAAHGGHRETDLAMLALFGCPNLARVLAAYDETRPLAEGWRERVGLHQLFPLLVHTVLFGGSYAEQAVRAAESALRQHGATFE